MIYLKLRQEGRALKRLRIVDDYTESFSRLGFGASISTRSPEWRMRAVIETWRGEYDEAR